MELIVKDLNRAYTIEYEGNVHKTLADIPEGAQVKIILPKVQARHVQAVQAGAQPEALTGQDLKLGHTYVIKVRQYMTKPASPEFDFMQKWNNNVPMPFRVMKGTVIRETRGMVMMDLHCEPFKTSHCMRCGRMLTHPVSKLYGIGPECGGHAHINPFETEEELQQALEEVRSKLASIKWRGWIIRSAVEGVKEVIS